MRVTIWIAISLLLGACESKQSAEEQAKKQAAELEAKSTSPKPAEKIHVPVPNEGHIPCEQLIPDPAAYQTALGETDPVTLADNTKSDAEAAAVCAIMKGGKPLTAKEQDAISKKTNHRLGI